MLKPGKSPGVYFYSGEAWSFYGGGYKQRFFCIIVYVSVSERGWRRGRASASHIGDQRSIPDAEKKKSVFPRN